MPGIAALNLGAAAINSLSCASAGDCSAVGYYTGLSKQQVFAVSEVNGTWQQAEEVPGTATLNQGRTADIDSVSCASPGNCSAGGYYTDGRGDRQVFVVSEVNGTWRRAEQVPGTATLNKGGDARIASLSCASVGNCSAVGYYTDLPKQQVFVVNEVNGIWQQAEQVPGTARLNRGRTAEIDSVSCASAGNCSAGGYYTDGRGYEQAFVVSEVNGTWRRAEQVSGTATRSDKGDAGITSVSCASIGNCSAGGHYGGYYNQQAFVVSQVNGTWQPAEQVPGTATLNKGFRTEDERVGIDSVSCASAGNCSAGGQYTDGHDYRQVFVVSEVNGTWQPAEEVPGTATLNKVDDLISSVSCASAGDCNAGGYYTDISGVSHGFVVSQVNGTWQHAEEVPGTWQSAEIDSVSCAPADKCSAGGTYLPVPVKGDPFVVSQTT